MARGVCSIAGPTSTQHSTPIGGAGSKGHSQMRYARPSLLHRRLHGIDNEFHWHDC